MNNCILLFDFGLGPKGRPRFQ